MALKKLVLVLSFLIITVIALIYGASPTWFFDTFLEKTPGPPSVDQSHVLRAVMTLYLGFGFFWLYAAFSDRWRDAGILVLAVFCGGLVVGRLLSVAVDGTPSPILVLYIGAELLLVPLCIWLLRRGD